MDDPKSGSSLTRVANSSITTTSRGMGLGSSNRRRDVVGADLAQPALAVMQLRSQRDEGAFIQLRVLGPAAMRPNSAGPGGHHDPTGTWVVRAQV
jgi:hypothetical protein